MVLHFAGSYFKSLFKLFSNTLLTPPWFHQDIFERVPQLKTPSLVSTEDTSVQLWPCLVRNVCMLSFGQYRIQTYYRGHAVAQLVEALHHKPEGRGLDYRWVH